VLGEVSLEQPDLQVARVFDEHLVAEVIGETPPALGQGAFDLAAEPGDQRVLPARIGLSTYHLTENRSYH
jgi:hypothetical protein